MKRLRELAPLLIAVLVSRFPFLFLGYGSGEESWKVAWRASELWHKGTMPTPVMTASPAFELLFSPVIAAGQSLAINAFILLLFLFAVISLDRILRTYQFASRTLLVWTAAFTPLLWSSSASASPGIVALFLVLISYESYISGRYLWAGGLLGFAGSMGVWCLVLLVPMAIMLEKTARRTHFPRLLGVALLGLVLPYVIVVLLSHHADFHSTLFDLLGRMTLIARLGTFGTELLSALGLIGTGSVIVSILLLGHKVVFRWDHPMFRFAVISSLTALVLVFLFPRGSDVLVPFLPFLLICLGMLLPPRHLAIACACIISYAVISFELFTVTPGKTMFSPHIDKGITIADFAARRRLLEWRRTVTTYPLPDSSVLITGRGASLWFENPLLVFSDDRVGWMKDIELAVPLGRKHIYYVPMLPCDAVGSLYASGLRLYGVENAQSYLRGTTDCAADSVVSAITSVSLPSPPD